MSFPLASSQQKRPGETVVFFGEAVPKSPCGQRKRSHPTFLRQTPHSANHPRRGPQLSCFAVPVAPPTAAPAARENEYTLYFVHVYSDSL